MGMIRSRSPAGRIAFRQVHVGHWFSSTGINGCNSTMMAVCGKRNNFIVQHGSNQLSRLDSQLPGLKNCLQGDGDWWEGCPAATTLPQGVMARKNWLVDAGCCVGILA